MVRKEARDQGRAAFVFFVFVMVRLVLLPQCPGC